MNMKKRFIQVACVTLLLPMAALATTSVAEQSYEQGHAVLNDAWDMEAQAVRMGYSSGAKLDYRERAMESYQTALELFEKSIAADADNYQAHSIRGLVLRKLGRHEEALASYNQALSINEKDLPTVEYLAEAYVELGEFDKAKSAYLDLVNQNTDLAEDLLAFMQMWIARPDPAQQALLQTEKYQDLTAWLEERKAISQSLALSSNSAAQNW